MKKNFSNQITGQIGENLVVAELGRRNIVATTFAGNVPDIDVLAYANGESLPLQVKTVKRGNLSVNGKDYLEIAFDGDKQAITGKSGYVDRGLIFVIVYLGDKLGDEKFYICTKGDVQDIVFENYTNYLAKKNGIRPRNPASTHCSYNESNLVSYWDNWDLILARL
jgi:hypothetical protein|tara:strand:+ start:629 stop:1126 length:498 start_codon:yes stop_codon:yes gene_type:complete